MLYAKIVLKRMTGRVLIMLLPECTKQVKNKAFSSGSGDRPNPAAGETYQFWRMNNA